MPDQSDTQKPAQPGPPERQDLEDLGDVDDLVFRNWRCFFEAATARDTVARALKVALVVGTVLILINQGDRILAGEMPSLFKIFLTYCVPYCVSTYSAASFRLALRRRELGLD